MQSTTPPTLSPTRTRRRATSHRTPNAASRPSISVIASFSPAFTTPAIIGGSGFVPAVFSDFTVAPIFEISSGRPFNILTGTDTNFDFNPLTDRPNAVAPNSGLTGCGTAPVLSKYSPTGAFNLPCYIDAPADRGPGEQLLCGQPGPQCRRETLYGLYRSAHRPRLYVLARDRAAGDR